MNRETITRISRENNEPDWLLSRRLSALEQFEKLPMPIFKYGIGIYVNPGSLNLADLNISKENKLIAKSKEAVILPFKEALEKYHDLIKQYFGSCIKSEDKLTALHYSSFNGLFIYIPENTLASPIQINFDLSSDSVDHILIVADKNSRAYILDSTKSNKNSKFRSQVIEIIAKESAKVDFISLQNLSKETFNFTSRKAIAEKDAVINWFDYCLGSKFSKVATTASLEGQGASSQNLGIFLGDETQAYDINNTTIHNSAFTKCDMLTKGVLKDKAKAIYRGLIKINPQAHNSQGYQKEDTLLIGEDAEADAVPILEIHNDNVKCKHGTTIGQLDQEKLFYMTSRGLDEETAKAKIIEGFFELMMSKLPEDFVNLSFREIIAERLKC